GPLLHGRSVLLDELAEPLQHAAGLASGAALGLAPRRLGRLLGLGERSQLGLAHVLLGLLDPPVGLGPGGLLAGELLLGLAATGLSPTEPLLLGPERDDPEGGDGHGLADEPHWQPPAIDSGPILTPASGPANRWSRAAGVSSVARRDPPHPCPAAR